VRAGERIPDVVLLRLGEGGVEEVSTAELFGGRRAILVGVPGAFTPTCSNEHLPGYVERAAELRAAGIERIVCLAVNDPYVMAAWGRDLGVGDAIEMVSDARGELTRALGLEREYPTSGLGVRCRRFAALLEDGVFRHVAVQAERGVTVCSAASLLDVLLAGG